MSEIISRADAKAQGLTRYFTGSPCKNRHVAEHFVSDGRCLECRRAKEATRHAKNPARQAAYLAENADKVKARYDAWRTKNKDKLEAQKAAWRDANPDKSRASVAAYRAANPNKVKEKDANRRARDRAAEGSHTAADILRIHDEQSGKCACCGKALNGSYHVDHIMPLALGGSNWPENLQLLCERDNTSKGAKHPYDFSLQYAKRHGVWPLFAIARGWDLQQAAA
jgi:5-methylcytosine-specific restriction endonuclease McrA